MGIVTNKKPQRYHEIIDIKEALVDHMKSSIKNEENEAKHIDVLPNWENAMMGSLEFANTNNCLGLHTYVYTIIKFLWGINFNK